MFISEEDPFRRTGLQQTYKINVINQNSTFHSNNNSLQRATINFEHSFTDFAQTISKCLYKAPYLQNTTLYNPFCPLCAKFVASNENFTFCDIKPSQKYSMHDKCLVANPSFSMGIVTDQEDDMSVLKIHKMRKMLNAEMNNKNLSLQSRQFLIEIIFYHPISDKKFGKIQKKQKISKKEESLEIKLSQIKVEDEYSPNMIVLPLTDYQLEISVHQIGEGRKQKITKYVNFKKVSTQNSRQIVFGNQEMQFQVIVCNTESQKSKILDEMNYKYVFPVNELSFVVIEKIYLELPEDLKDSESDSYNQIMESSSSKLLEFLDIDSKLEEQKSRTSRRTHKSNLSFQSTSSKQQGWKGSKQSVTKKSSNLSENNDHEKVNLEKLIKTNTLKEFVKNNTQSRSFQSFLQKADYEELDLIIEYMRGYFADLMKHEYGNYMMQKLFSVCNLEKRYKILQFLVPQLTDIVMNKQGTHAFQDFLSFFTTEPQYSLVLQKLRQNFFELCIHSNATHFIQKIIKIFPFELLSQFFYYCIQNLYQFGCDKNGMCVVKYMIKKLKESSQKTKVVSIDHEEILKVVQEYKKWFVQATVLNLDAFVGDMYGNYLVQFNFELFQNTFTSTLKDSILMKMPQYSLSKYSTNVVFKCLSAYWVQDREYISSVLKQVFQPYLILDMYTNKDGNKILLELMQKYEGYEIWNKLYNTLINTQPTRFYHDRWGACLGSRSGNVGGNFSSFSDAMHKANPKRKNNKMY